MHQHQYMYDIVRDDHRAAIRSAEQRIRLLGDVAVPRSRFTGRVKPTGRRRRPIN